MPNLIRSASLRLPSEEVRHATWLEIFFDLIFAVIIIQLSSRLLTHLNPVGIFQSATLFIPVMWTWASYTVFAARFDNDDAIHWVATFIIMFAGVIMAIQIPVGLEKGSTGFAVGFLISQIAVLLLYSRTIYDDATPTSITLLYLIGFGLGGVCWVSSLFFDTPIRFILWTLGMGIYLVTPWVGRKKILSKAPLDTIYIPERFGAFTLIILGQIIASVVFGLQSAHWTSDSLLTSIMAFVLAIIIWVQYYRFTQVADYKCTLGSGQPYIYMHIPLIFSLMIIGVCAEEFIKAPALIQKNIHVLFCFAVILYLTSFYLLQYLTIRKFKIRGLSYVGGIGAILCLFFVYPFSPEIIISGIVVIFAMLFSIQYSLGRKKGN